MRILVATLFLICATSLHAQFKYSAGIGMGFSFPLPDFDEFNTTIADSGLEEMSSFWVPLSWDLSWNAYPSLRIGLFRISSNLLKNKASEGWALTVTMSGISFQTFFTFLRRFEATFGFAPLWARADFSQKAEVKTSKLGLSTSTKAGIRNSTFSYYSWIGVKFHLTTFLALEGNLGHLRARFKGNKWKAEGKTTDITGKIDLTRPFFRFGVTVGW